MVQMSYVTDVVRDDPEALGKFLRLLAKETYRDAGKLVQAGTIPAEKRWDTSCLIGAAVVRKMGLEAEVKAFHEEMKSYAG